MLNEPIIVLHIIPSLSKGGIESFLLNQYSVADKQRYRFDFLVLDGKYSPYEREIRDLGGSVYYADVNLGSVYHLLGNFIKLAKHLRKLEYSILHTHNNTLNGIVILASILSRGKKITYVSHSHGSDFSDNMKGGLARRLIYAHLFKQLTIRLPHLRLACGEKAGRALYGRNEFKIIHNSIDLKRFMFCPEEDCEKFRQAVDIPAGAKRIYGNISRFDTGKNFPFIVEIFSRIHQMEPDSYLILGGSDSISQDDSTKETVSNKIRELHLEENVRITGQWDNLAPFYHSIDCLIFPSLSEGLSISAIEAQAASLAIVASTNVTEEIDMGLGLVEFCDLSSSPLVWAEVAVRSRRYDGKDKTIIERKLSERGYNMMGNHELTDCYENILLCRKSV